MRAMLTQLSACRLVGPSKLRGLHVIGLPFRWSLCRHVPLFCASIEFLLSADLQIGHYNRSSLRHNAIVMSGAY